MKQGNVKVFNAKKLHDLRIGVNKTLKELSADLGIKDVTVWSWEKGIREPSLSYLIKLSNYFHISPNEFILKECLK